MPCRGRAATHPPMPHRRPRKPRRAVTRPVAVAVAESDRPRRGVTFRWDRRAPPRATIDTAAAAGPAAAAAAAPSDLSFAKRVRSVTVSAALRLGRSGIAVGAPPPPPAAAAETPHAPLARALGDSTPLLTGGGGGSVPDLSALDGPSPALTPAPDSEGGARGAPDGAITPPHAPHTPSQDAAAAPTPALASSAPASEARGGRRRSGTVPWDPAAAAAPPPPPPAAGDGGVGSDASDSGSSYGEDYGRCDRAWRYAFAYAVVCISEYVVRMAICIRVCGRVHKRMRPRARVDMYSRMRAFAYPNTAAATRRATTSRHPRRPRRRRPPTPTPQSRGLPAAHRAARGTRRRPTTRSRCGGSR